MSVLPCSPRGIVLHACGRGDEAEAAAAAAGAVVVLATVLLLRWLDAAAAAWSLSLFDE